MASSSTRRIQNDMTFYEDSSDRKIASNLYYTVRIICKGDIESEKIRTTAKSLAKTIAGDDGKPLAVYCYDKEMYLLFSSLEKNSSHHLNGSHHGICSFYASKLSQELKSDTVCSIVELDSRTKVIVYFQTKIYENVKRKLLKMSKTLQKKDLEALTFSEMVKDVPNWEDVPVHDRFGVFYKHVTISGKDKYSVLSEMVDLKTMDKYVSYLFD